MSEYLFSHNLNLQNDPTNRFIAKSFSPIHKFNSAVQSVVLTRLHLEKLFFPQRLWYAWRIYNYAKSVAFERSLRPKSAGSDLLSYITKEQDGEVYQRATTG